MRVCEALGALVGFFSKKSIDTSRVDAELLLAFVLGCGRLDLFLKYDRELSVQEIDLLRSLSIRRARREPLQYIVGDVDFYGQHLEVTPAVLIPRPETEELVYQLHQYLQEHPTNNGLDLGTGSGNIAIALTALIENLRMTAVDQSKEALAVAQRNAAKNQVEGRINFVQSFWFETLQGQTFDFIISNPPYLTEEELKEAQPEVRLYEPHSALVAKDNGLADLRHILENAPSFLNPGGFVVFETGLNQHKALGEWANTCGYKKIKTSLDLHQRERYFWAWLA